MEVSDLNDILNVRAVKMENIAFEDDAVDASMSDPFPQYVTESDLGLMQSGSEILQTQLAVLPDITVEDDDTMQSDDSGEEVIVQLMDIRTRLSKLRTMLERRLGADLSQFTFWLQDAKLLENHKTLVEQCIRGEGVVQVNIVIKNAEKKINILDVLKPDEEVAQLSIDDPEELTDLELELSVPARAIDRAAAAPASAPASASAPAPASAPLAHAAAVRWIVDPSFGNTRPKTPHDPKHWCVQHVKLWIQWAVRQFNLTGIKLGDWNVNGTQLCALTNTQFKEKVPSDPGDIFWTHFELLRKCKFVAVIQNDEDDQNEKELLEMPQSAIKKKPKQVILTPSLEDVSYASMRSGNNGQIQLWQFLLELLTSAEYFDVIRWHGCDGEFKLLEPERVARLWGARKNKPAMNYEKLSRALRYYYDGDMIAKVGGKRFVYKFVCDLRQLIGYGPEELADLVKEVHDTHKTDKNDDTLEFILNSS